MRLLAAFCALFAMSLPGLAQEKAKDSGKQLVKIQAIRVKGTRLPEISILRLTGLQIGQTINETKVRTALQSATDSGLFTNISYVYESASHGDGVILELRIDDQLPLVPATIRIPDVDEEQIWQYLQRVDPLFTRALPATDNAIQLYQQYIGKYLETHSHKDHSVTAKLLGSSGHVTGIEFHATKLRSFDH